jgi:hypothetical protein
MQPSPEPDGGDVVVVEFPATPGLVQVALTPAELVKRSSEALDAASEVIRGMASRFSGQLADLEVKPSQVELEFGVKLTAEAGAFIAKAGGEGALSVRMTWHGDG